MMSMWVFSVCENEKRESGFFSSFFKEYFIPLKPPFYWFFSIGKRNNSDH